MSHPETTALSSLLSTVQEKPAPDPAADSETQRKGSLASVGEPEWDWGFGEGKRTTHGPIVWLAEITFFRSALPGARPPRVLNARQSVPASVALHICLLVLLTSFPQAYKQNKPNDQTNREFSTACVEGSECEALFIPCLGEQSLGGNMHGAIPYHTGREAFERSESAHIPPSFN